MSDLAFRYYEPLVGAWSGRFSFAVTDKRALAARGVTTWLPLRMFALFSWLGTRMSTTLAKDGDDAFVHTTRVTLLGMPVYSTRERIVIDGGGRSFTMTGTQGALGTAETYEAHGEIADDAKGATYQITFYGAELTQRTRVVPDGLSLEQESPWTRGSVVLGRR